MSWLDQVVDGFRVGFVPGVSPDKWSRVWRERVRRTLVLEPTPDDVALAALHEGRLAMCFLRLPVERAGLNLIPLWFDDPVVVASRDHPVAAYDEIALAELSDELLLQVPPLTALEAVETVAAGTGLVVLPKSVARIHQRKDVVTCRVTDREPTRIGLAWLVDNPDDDTETFIGIVRGRSARSSRG